MDRLIEARLNPVFASDVEKFGRDATRDLLWYLSSELNRLDFQYWNLAQLAIGILALWLVVKLPDAARGKWGIVAMLAIVLFLTVVITPGARAGTAGAPDLGSVLVPPPLLVALALTGAGR